MSTAKKIQSVQSEFRLIAPKEADMELVCQNIGLLKSIVKKFSKKINIEDSEYYSIACLALVEAASSFDASKAKFSTWATKIITQRIIQSIRKSKKQKLIEMSSLDPVDIDHYLIDKKGKILPTELLSLIAPKEKDTKTERQSKSILSMHYLDGKSWSEIGRIIGMTREGVRQKAQRALELIRKNNVDLLGNSFYY